jgi:nicotinamidase-related amidase
VSDTEKFHAATTALLLMDIQNGIVAGYVPEGSDLLERVGEARATARDAQQLQVLVHVGFRTGYPDVAANNKIFGRASEAGYMLEADASTDLHEGLGARSDDVVIRKRRVSAFKGTDLDLILRARGIRTVVLGGIATSGVVLSTVREAADLDYNVVVLRDCCADPDETVQEVLLDRIFPVQADVITVADYTTRSA